MNSRFHVELTDAAFANLREIRDYIARDRPIAAELFLLSILDKIDSLESFPMRCPTAPERELQEKGCRHLIHGPYRMIFIVEANTVSVLHVIHGARFLNMNAPGT